MKFLATSSSFLALALLTPLAAQAEMTELTDTELEAVQGKAGAILPGSAFANYWTEFTTVQGDPALHYAGWGLMGVGYSLMIPFQQTELLDYKIHQAPPPVNHLAPVTKPLYVIAVPPAAVGMVALTQGLYLLYINGEFTTNY